MIVLLYTFTAEMGCKVSSGGYPLEATMELTVISKEKTGAFAPVFLF